MASIFDFNNYRDFLDTWIDQHPQKGRGLKGHLAEAMGISSTMMSLILKGEKYLSLEQATDLSEHLGFNENETDYLFVLVEWERAGTFKLKEKLRRKIKKMKTEANQISKRVNANKELSEEVKSIFYSSWVYSGVRNMTAIDEINNSLDISKKLGIPQVVVDRVLDFLIQNNLCKKTPNGVTYGTQNTHVPHDSPHVIKHHQNWRLKAFHEMEVMNENNLFFTSPMSLSKDAAEEIRKLLPTTIEKVVKIVGPSKSEKVCCLNIDWFEY